MVIFVLNLGFMISCIVYGLFINECSNGVYTTVCILLTGLKGRGVVQRVRLLLSSQLSYRRSTTAAYTTITLCVSIVLVAVCALCTIDTTTLCAYTLQSLLLVLQYCI